MTTLDELEAEVRSSMDADQLRLTSDLCTNLGLPGLPTWFFGDQDLSLAGPHLERTAAQIAIQGTLDHKKMGLLSLRCEATVKQGVADAALQVTFPESLSLKQLLARLNTSAAVEADRFLAALTAVGARFGGLESGGAVVFEVRGAISVEIGGAKLRLAFVSATFQADGGVPIELRGSLTLGDLAMPLAVSLQNPVQVLASAPDVTCERLLSTLGLEPLAPSSLPMLSTSLDQLRIALEPDVRISARVNLSGLGMLTFVAAEINHVAGVLAALEVAGDFRFSRLGTVFAPLDQLSDAVTFGSPALLMANLVEPRFPFPRADGTWGEVAVEAGAVVKGHLKLKGFGMDALAAMFRMEDLPFELPVSTPPADVRLTAQLPQTTDPIPGVLTVRNLRVTATVEPYTLSASGEAKLVLFGMELPELRLGASLGGPLPSLYLRAEQPWRQPLGLQIDIEDLALQFSSPPPSFGLAGKIRLENRVLDMATQFVGGTPSMLAAEFHGDLRLADLLLEMVGVNRAPAFFEPVLTDPTIYMVLNPTGVVIAERTYTPGLGLSGRAGFLGVEAALRLSAKPDRLMAEGSLSEAIKLPPVVEITGSGGVGAPSFALDSSGDPLMTLSARVLLLGIVQDVRGKVNASGVEFSLDQTVGPVRARLNAQLGDGRFQADGTCAFQLTTQVGPIRLYAGGPDLGTIKLDTAFEAATSMSVRKSGDVQFTVGGSFSLMGETIRVPAMQLSPQPFPNLPEAIVRYVTSNAAALFAHLLSSADAWLNAVKASVITAVENAARVLKEQFRQNPEQIARGLITTLGSTTQQVADALKKVDEAPQAVFNALTKLAKPEQEVVNALNAVGYAATEIGEGLKALGRTQEQVTELLKGTDLPVATVEEVIKILFPIPLPPIYKKQILPPIYKKQILPPPYKKKIFPW